MNGKDTGAHYKILVHSILSFPEAEFLVEVENSAKTSHRVRLKRDYYRRFSGGVLPPEDFVRKSFEFLLEREPNTSILREFSLEEIENYFPEYAHEIGKR